MFLKVSRLRYGSKHFKFFVTFFCFTFEQVMKLHPEILQRILSTILNVVMFEDCKNQWSMSRPLLGLILLYEDYFR